MAEANGNGLNEQGRLHVFSPTLPTSASIGAHPQGRHDRLRDAGIVAIEAAARWSGPVVPVGTMLWAMGDSA
jgi:hypothetical protein